MAQHGKDTVVIVGRYDLTSDATAVEVGADVTPHDSTAFGASGHRNTLGLRNGGVQLTGLYNDAAGAIYDVFKTAFQSSSPQIAAVFPKLTTVGNPAIMCYANETRFDDSVKFDDLVSVVAYLQAAEDGVDFGVSLHALAAETASTNTASVDNAASSANGGVASLHVTAVSGTTPSATIKVQHSANNSTWADLVTFTAATASTTERVEVAAGTTVNRYLRAISTITGTNPSFTYTVAFARR